MRLMYYTRLTTFEGLTLIAALIGFASPTSWASAKANMGRSFAIGIFSTNRELAGILALLVNAGTIIWTIVIMLTLSSNNW